jgi:23S rRNA pseudouridine1911/1915/1917 synthase
VRGVAKEREWTCRLKLGPDENARGKMKVDLRSGKEAETHFRVLQSGKKTSLIEARPFTGRTHQIRVHLAESGLPVVGDELYGPQPAKARGLLGLRAVKLSYHDPFTKRWIVIEAPAEEFCREFGFGQKGSGV